MEGFSNSQLVMITEVNLLIEQMKGEGKEYKEIRQACIDKYGRSHWLIIDQRQRDEAIAGALFAYAMDDEQREAVIELKKLTGYLLI